MKFNKSILFSVVTFITLGCKRNISHEPEFKTPMQELVKHDLQRKQGSTFDIFNQILPEHKYYADTTHSSVQFRTRHWGIYDIVGWFESYEMVIYYDNDDFSDIVVEVRLRPSSIRMPNMAMADHLNVEKFGFFESNKFPEIVFKSHTFLYVSKNSFQLIGNLTIKDITKEVVFDLKLNGYAFPPNKTGPGFTIEGKINLMDYNLGNAELLPGNQLPIVGDEVFITSNIRLITDYD